MIFDPELFKTHLSFIQAVLMPSNVFVIYEMDTHKIIFLPCFLYFLNLIYHYKISKKECYIIYKISRTLQTSAVLLFLKWLFEACYWAVAESECSNSTDQKATYCIGVIVYCEWFILMHLRDCLH